MRPDFVPDAIAFVTDDDVHEPKLGIGQRATQSSSFSFISYRIPNLSSRSMPSFSFRDNVPIGGRRGNIRR
jgi:hypothetical protein